MYYLNNLLFFPLIVRLTPGVKAIAAAVKVGYSISSYVLTFVTTTDTPLINAVAADNLARVSIESLRPLRDSDICNFSSSVITLPVAAMDKIFRVSSLTLRLLNLSKVYWVCL